MISSSTVREDLALKRVARRRVTSAIEWHKVVEHEALLFPSHDMFVRVGNEKRELDLGEVAQTIGNAVEALSKSREEADPFTVENRELVASLTRAVAMELFRRNDKVEEAIIVTPDELAMIIDRCLIRQNQFEVAKALLIQRAAAQEADQKAADKTSERAVRVVRRNGQAVLWNPDKIESAVKRAFVSMRQDYDPAARNVANAVTASVLASGTEYIHIEDLQDKVQNELMEQRYFKVAAHYILYREQRAQERREEEERLKAEEAERARQGSFISVKPATGNAYFWYGLDLRKRIDFAMSGLDLSMNFEEIEHELRRSIYDGISEADLKKTIILNAKSMIERDADFSKFAGRLLLTYIYEEVLGWDIERDGIEKLSEFHRLAFKANMVRAVDIGRINPKLLDYDLDKLAQALDPASDLEFEFLGIQTLYDRYLIIDKTGGKQRRLETPQLFWMRVSMGLFIADGAGSTDHIINLYKLYKSRRFCSSTPTLFNSGTNHSQLSSCYLYKVDDNIESIMVRGIAENAFLSKWAGGLGGSWTSVRGTGSHIHGTNGESQGVIPFLKLHNDQLVAVNQGGKRRGSGCAYLETWHNDVLDFLELRRNTGDVRRRTPDMNTANWIPDLFMKRVEGLQSWTLFRSSEVPELHELYGKAFEEKYVEYEAKAERGEIFGQTIPAIQLWREMLKMLFETGHPWITFKDPCNVRSPQDHAGVIHSSNLCTEITLNSNENETAVCNLGSVVLDQHVDSDGNLDHKKLRETVKIAVRALDNVIDINFYPTEAAKQANTSHRPVGLGVMGLQNALYKKDIPFASKQAIEFNDEFMEAIAYYAYEASSDLAAEHGSYSTFPGSKWDRGMLPLDTLDLLEEERGQKIEVPRGGKLDWDALREKIKKQGMRNSNVLAIAPTATISNIMGTSPCIEPNFRNLYVKSNLGGDFIILNTYLVQDLKRLNLWNQEMIDSLKEHDGELGPIEGIPEDLKKKYATAFSVHYFYLIEAASRRQKWIDQSQSVNLFFTEPKIAVLSDMYRSAWHKGLKTTYYLRSLGASKIEGATLSKDKAKRGIVSGEETRTFTEEEKKMCSIEAMLNGGDCEACQ